MGVVLTAVSLSNLGLRAKADELTVITATATNKSEERCGIIKFILREWTLLDTDQPGNLFLVFRLNHPGSGRLHQNIYNERKVIRKVNSRPAVLHGTCLQFLFERVSMV